MRDLRRLPKDQLVRLLQQSMQALEGDVRDDKRLLHDLQAHRIELEMQNRDLSESQQALEAARDRYADLYDFSPVAYLTLDRRGRIVECNLTAAEVMGRPRGALLGHPLAARLAGGQSAILFAHLDAVFIGMEASAQPQRIELTITPPQQGGQCRTLLMESRLAANAPGGDVQAGGALCRSILLDVTEQRRSEAEMRRQERRYRAVIETAGDGFWLMDSEGRILEVNEAYVRRSGYSREELCRMSPADLEAVEPPGGARVDLAKIKQVGRDLFESAHRAKDGEVWPVDVSVTFLEADGGLYFAFLRDIGARQAAERHAAEEARIISRLQRLATRFLGENNLEPLLGEMVETAIAISDADFGDIQLLNPVTSQLQTGAQVGFPRRLPDHGNSADQGKGVHATALQRRERVVVPDIESSPLFAGTAELEIHRRAGVRALQSTPLLSRSGAPLGTIATYCRLPSLHDDSRLRLMDLLARQAADMIERARAEEALEQAVKSQAAILAAMPDLMLEVDAEGRCLQVWSENTDEPAFSNVSLLGRTVAEALPAQAAARVMAALQVAEKEGRSRGTLIELETPQGARWLELSVSCKDADVVPHRFIVVSREITARKRLEREIIEVSTAEQERIGREIHDGMGQQLSGLAMMAEALKRDLAERGLTAESALAAELHDQLQTALRHARLLARGLAPLVIEAEGLADSLFELAERIQHTARIDCQYLGSQSVKLRDASRALNLYRVAQEAVQNALKHGRPQCITIDLREQDGALVLEVRDDGDGIDPEGERGEGLGLHIMQYRAGVMGGDLHVGHAAAGGTLVRCVVPLDAPQIP